MDFRQMPTVNPAKESDLYPPLKAFLESQGYEVKGEVQHCDVVAVRAEEEPLIVELKLALNLTVFLQAVDRLAMSDFVYLCVPREIATLKRNRRRVMKMIRMLGIGLITVDLGARRQFVEVIVDPAEYRPRQNKRRKQRLLKEFAERVGDTEAGGSAMTRGQLTAYRQRALLIADYLISADATKASIIAKAIGDPATRDILYRNVYSWFDRHGKGIYSLSPQGQREVPAWLQRRSS